MGLASIFLLAYFFFRFPGYTLLAIYFIAFLLISVGRSLGVVIGKKQNGPSRGGVTVSLSFFLGNGTGRFWGGFIFLFSCTTLCLCFRLRDAVDAVGSRELDF